MLTLVFIRSAFFQRVCWLADKHSPKTCIDEVECVQKPIFSPIYTLTSQTYFKKPPANLLAQFEQPLLRRLGGVPQIKLIDVGSLALNLLKYFGE